MKSSSWRRLLSRMTARVPRPQARVVALCACLLLAACSKSALYSDLDEQQANQVMAALLGAGIDASKEPSITNKDRWEVNISQGDFPSAMQVLNANGLPRRRSESMGELFKKESFASSALEEKARYIYGLEEGMRQKLLKVNGVVDAEVSIALPDREPLSGETPDSSASVMIFHRPDVNLSDRETDLKVYIKDGIAGLKDVNKVTIKFFPVGQKQASQKIARSGAMPAALSSISPLAIGITAGVVLVLAIGIALVARLRGGKAQPKQPETAPVWKP